MTLIASVVYTYSEETQFSTIISYIGSLIFILFTWYDIHILGSTQLQGDKLTHAILTLTLDVLTAMIYTLRVAIDRGVATREDMLLY